MLKVKTDPDLRVTDSAIAHIRRSIQKMVIEPRPIGIRVGVRKAGCSGYEYTLEYAFADTLRDLDQLFEAGEFKIVIDKAVYAKFMQGGTVMDYRQEGLKAGLLFDNPNVAHQCGCGDSFTLVNEQAG